MGTQKDTHVSHLFVVYALNFEATGARVPFAALKERTEEMEDLAAKAEIARAMLAEGKNQTQVAEALGYKSHSSVSELLKKYPAC
jgi:hypothetical protein